MYLSLVHFCSVLEPIDSVSIFGASAPPNPRGQSLYPDADLAGTEQDL